MKNSRPGFTLIELIVVLIIIGILASIAAPMMSSMKAKAMCSEAVAAMGTIRNAIRAYIMEYGAAPAIPMGNSYLYSGGMVERMLGLNYNDFNGVYFSPNCYNIKSSSSPTSYSISVIPNPPLWTSNPGTSNTASKASEVIGLTDTTDGSGARLWMGSDGSIHQVNFSKSGYQ